LCEPSPILLGLSGLDNVEDDNEWKLVKRERHRRSMPVFGFGSEYWMWATLSHRGECTNLGRSLGFVWSQITISYYRVVIFLERILIMIQKEFDTVWTLCWMEGFALPPTV